MLVRVFKVCSDASHSLSSLSERYLRLTPLCDSSASNRASSYSLCLFGRDAIIDIFELLLCVKDFLSLSLAFDSKFAHFCSKGRKSQAGRIGSLLS
jgi:hypothetical protein